MHLVVENAERELAQVEQSRAEVLRVDEVVDGGIRQRLSRQVMLRESLQHGLLPRPLLHQLHVTTLPKRHLRRRLHEVGLIAEGAEGADALVVAHHVDEMAELVEERRHVVVRNGRRQLRRRRWEVADHAGHGKLRLREGGSVRNARRP